MNDMGKYCRKYIGMKFVTNEGYEIEVVDGGDKNGYCKIKFSEPKEYIAEVCATSIVNGGVKNLYHPSICGWAGFGENPAIPSSIKGKTSICYECYRDMVRRCKDPNDWRYEWYGGLGVTISEEWGTYSDFSYWFKDNYIKGYQLDKDVLQKNIPTNEKIYSPSTCMFISKKENLIEASSRRKYKTGINHPGAKNIKYHETKALTRNDFKKSCKRKGWDFEDFEEVFAEWYIRKNGDRKRKYFYFLK